jgi:hypothetical protein
MVTDPATTPARPRNQVIFAAAVAGTYGLFMQFNIVFGLFYALTLVTLLRGLTLYLETAGVFAPERLNALFGATSKVR